MPLSSATRESNVGRIFIAGAAIVVAALLAYGGTLSVPFIGDDGGAIVENDSIRDLRALGHVLSPPVGEGLTVGGRPLLNLTLAINYAISGTNVWSYHVVNLLIHIAAGLLVFGLVRRTAVRIAEQRAGGGPSVEERSGSMTVGAALLASLWIVHPLNTESVTYIVQRAESQMALFYLLTLYAFVRWVDSGTARGWMAVSVTACLCGMATKEVMVTAPIIVFLYDATFVVRSWTAPWALRKTYYLLLAGTWLLLAGLVVGTNGRGGSAGFGTGMSPASYALTQCDAILHYLRLVVWPHPLIFDYGAATTGGNGIVVIELIVLAGTFGWAAIALKNHSVYGFLGVAFFVTLAPSSSIVPVATQTIAEHRMYLPSVAATIALGGFASAVGLARWQWVGLLIASAFGFVTYARNQIYRDDLRLYRYTVAQRLQNPRAYLMVGNALLQRGRAEEAIAAYRSAISVSPDYVEAYHDLGSALVRAGRTADALPFYETALRLHPVAKTHYALASALADTGRQAEAFSHYSRALQIDPGFAEAHNNRANLLLQNGNPAEALPDYEAAIRTKPDYFEAHMNLAVALGMLGRWPEARSQAEIAVALQPRSGIAHSKLADISVEMGDFSGAMRHFEEAIKTDSALLRPYVGMGQLLVRMGHPQEALRYLEAALRIDDGATVHHELAKALAQCGRVAEAVQHDEIALLRDPQFSPAAEHLAGLKAEIARRTR